MLVDPSLLTNTRYTLFACFKVWKSNTGFCFMFNKNTRSREGDQLQFFVLYLHKMLSSLINTGPVITNICCFDTIGTVHSNRLCSEWLGSPKNNTTRGSCLNIFYWKPNCLVFFKQKMNFNGFFLQINSG